MTDTHPSLPPRPWWPLLLLVIIAAAAILTYANSLTDRVASGGTVKYVYQDLGSHTVVID